MKTIFVVKVNAVEFIHIYFLFAFLFFIIFIFIFIFKGFTESQQQQKCSTIIKVVLFYLNVTCFQFVFPFLSFFPPALSFCFDTFVYHIHSL